MNHYLHKDILYKLFLLTVKTICWFNPLLILMFREAGRDLESLCDSRMMEYTASREEKISYGKLLLKTAAEKKPVGEIAADLNDGTAKFKERVIYMMHADKRKKGVPIALAIIFSLVTLNGLIGCSIARDDHSASDNRSIKNPVSESEIKNDTIPTDAPSSPSGETASQGIEISEYFEKYRELETLLQMEPVENPNLNVGYEKDGFSITYSTGASIGDPACSMSDTGSEIVQLYGCTIGDDIDIFEKNLMDNGWKREGNRMKENYVMQGTDHTYWLNLEFGADGAVTSWYWSNWRDGDYAPEIHENTEDIPVELSAYLYSYEPLIEVLNMEHTDSWDTLRGNSYVRDGFYLEFLPYQLSMKNEGNPDVTLNGCRLGDSIDTFDHALLNDERGNKWIRLDEGEQGIYVKPVFQPNRVLRLELSCDEQGKVTSWYLNDWQESADTAEDLWNEFYAVQP